MSDTAAERALLALPLERRGYSDRTAAYLARLAKLAYIRFEDTEQRYTTQVLDELLDALHDQTNSDKTPAERRALAEGRLLKALAPERLKPYQENLQQLRTLLVQEQMELLTVINEPHLHSQAFVAKVTAGAVDHPLGSNAVAIVFRGSEKEIRDWATNFSIGNVRMKCGFHEFQIHHGFLRAFKSIQATLENALQPLVAEGCLLYLTGHSLGGALAMIATHQLGRKAITYNPDHDFPEKADYPGASTLTGERIAACYTFGSPRVAGNGFEQSIKSPLYRIVHADDPVPRVPPVYLPTILLCVQKLLARIPAVRDALPTALFLSSKLLALGNREITRRWSISIAMGGNVLEVSSQFVHHGDMRYIARQVDGEPLMVLSNPDLLVRLLAFIQHSFKHPLKVVADHSMDKYVELTALYARQRREDLAGAPTTR